MPYKVVRKKLSALKPNERNPRSIKDHKFQKLVANMQAFPKMLEIRPVVTDEHGVILGGNMRYQAAKHLGWDDIPTINASDLTPEEREYFVILDNQDFGEWDFGLLANEYAPETLVQLGFEPAELGINLEEAKFVAPAGDGEDTDIGDEQDFETSHVKMVQLFLDTKTHPEFMAAVEGLQEQYNTDNLTDTVFKAVLYAYTHSQQKV